MCKPKQNFPMFKPSKPVEPVPPTTTTKCSLCGDITHTGHKKINHIVPYVVFGSLVLIFGFVLFSPIIAYYF